MLIYFPFDNVAAAGCGFKFNGHAPVPGAPLPQSAYSIHDETGPDWRMASVDQCSFDPVEERVLS